MTPRLGLLLIVLVAFAGCRDATAPTAPMDRPTPAGLEASTQLWAGGPSTLVQAPWAPALETYQVSFWARRGKATTVKVNYLPAPGHAVGQPFLRFNIRKDGLQRGADGRALLKHDSVYITLTIDPVAFDVKFEPSGVRFAMQSPASLTLWYTNANPDVNGDGVVDRTDALLRAESGLYYIKPHKGVKRRLPSNNDPQHQTITGPLLHFSEYAISW
jgi:hypothetical protein